LTNVWSLISTDVIGLCNFGCLFIMVPDVTAIINFITIINPWTPDGYFVHHKV